MAINEKVEFDIDAPASLAYATLLDVEALPEWSSSHKSATVVERDAAGNPSLVKVEAGLMGISDSLTFRYEFTPETKVAWQSEGEGMAVKSQGGFYQLTPIGDDKVHVVVDMHIDLKVKLPGFVVKKGVKMSAEIASKGFTKEVLKRKAAQ
ncbi:Cyclase/dehydrase OS=Tsukamurella paurometabola (strain ATCC 8368 / DSM / CCUG 35730 / CIP 100753/ JCM 10117 / KCTC 9821 / NBRC 16120 / NCIMB 702349 /NCTC 13040) OX=521096 GN=Tpau_2811 PE=4 SV=1 [Tsukamurella paurometabola]|uniref:Cyclase/dehydrase n=1 Tax=Tsukamurella paurometabola (strain ATCC 8368 / DSM 20162 / CCUG 35730 / CIP 100753 / JCM 10117 / KCTC 9821 / NBRC 16120 / NCIMB 702349 / NCTC 13040) TaxID=521096 RepID=D5UTC4_TSUPD|nr:SRPBCC family protein [Tsukamurella paurometabola]ADG79409.1 cyclase/dehydrase [Tsukamurella paurometabola DSM 20162]SUP35606.1 Polyketide cyclase / dehydrase and lipid transport [Tsukamurella paurometabola]